MNNKLIADIEMNRKRNNLLRDIVPELEKLVKSSSTFTKEESIEALNEIKERLVLLKEEENNSYIMVKKKRFELRQVCTHEALIKRDNYYECVICGECFKFENIDFNTFLLECLDERHYLFVMASDIISEIAMNDEDIFDVFEDRLYEKYKDYDKEDNLLIYRRSR